MSKIEEKLQALGLTLPQPPAKGGLYTPAKRFGEKLLYVSGCGPSLDGTPIVGKLGEEVTQEQGYDYARDSMLNVLAVVKAAVGDLDLVKCPVKVTCFVASTPDFYAQPQVANGGTQLLIDLWGQEEGAPSRSAIGMSVLPGNMPVETEALFELK
ncbi:MAG TPA: RidA family protein [Candidatus Acutalibacter pullistercoris]|uniref:RidA family protein n=1 Tax=Candidatus Acutalibacter pullistercoris TaxID=2838418 RepID=A0A9D1YDI9_9FIRM|nr:RidA family protein [Candidatus Acutalibacter pullistercoris]